MTAHSCYTYPKVNRDLLSSLEAVVFVGGGAGLLCSQLLALLHPPEGGREEGRRDKRDVGRRDERGTKEGRKKEGGTRGT